MTLDHADLGNALGVWPRDTMTVSFGNKLFLCIFHIQCHAVSSYGTHARSQGRTRGPCPPLKVECPSEYKEQEKEKAEKKKKEKKKEENEEKGRNEKKERRGKNLYERK